MHYRRAVLGEIVDLARHPLGDAAYRLRCRDIFDRDGVLALEGFLGDAARQALEAEAGDCRHLAFFSRQDHNVYLDSPDPSMPATDARSHPILSTKGAVTTDQVPVDSPLRAIYDSDEFRGFLCSVLGEEALHEYADPLSSINLNYYEEGQELGWHFDNSEFSVTLLVRPPVEGGQFEFINDLRNTEAGDDNEAEVAEVLTGDGKTVTRTTTPLAAQAGTLVVFRGRDALHRVTPVVGPTTRVLVVFAYNTEPGISLSESARLTFFGRLV